MSMLSNCRGSRPPKSGRPGAVRRHASRTSAAVLALAAIQAWPALAQRADSLYPTPPPAATACGACLRGPVAGLTPVNPAREAGDTGRPRAIEYSSSYYTRLTIHRIGSYVELPLFATEYVIGQKLITYERDNPTMRSSLRGPHQMVAAGLEALFAVNTVTGVWNLVESRHDPAGRARRWIHSIAMLLADGGFVATAGSAGGARRTDSGANQHRDLAIASMGLATASTLMMWLWKD